MLGLLAVKPMTGTVLTCIKSMLSYVIVGQMVCFVLGTVLKNLCVFGMQTMRDLEAAESGFASVAFGPEGTVLYSSPLLQKLIEFDHEQDRVLHTKSMQIHALSVSMCGRVVAFADANGSIGLLRFQEGDLILLQGTTSCFRCLTNTLSCALPSATLTSGNYL